MIDLNDTALPRIPSKCRVTLLALGDVGSTLLMGLRLMGGDVIGSVGICDVRPGVSERWEFELNQIQSPDGAALPPVDIIAPEQLFDGDVFLFCASRMIPDTSVILWRSAWRGCRRYAFAGRAAGSAAPSRCRRGSDDCGIP